MNPNILQALQEKRDAEKMMVKNDYDSARDKLLRAQLLYPAFDHVGSMLAVCDILHAASIKLPGCEIDYYWVLQLEPSSAYSEVRSRYQKLVTLLQPIRNKFPRTEFALKLIQDAFSVLSDQGKRSAFDLKRGVSRDDYESFNIPLGAQISNKATVATAQSSSGCKDFSGQIWSASSIETEMLSTRIGDMGPNLQAFHNIDKKPDKIISQEPSLLSADVDSRGNISTIIDISADSINSTTASHSTSSERKFSWLSEAVAQQRLDQDFYNFENDRKLELFEVGQIWAVHYNANLHHNYRYARVEVNSKAAVCVTWLKPIPVTRCERIWCDTGLPVACGSFEMNLEMSDEVNWPMVSSYKCSWVPGVTEEQFEIYPKRGEIWALYKHWDLGGWANNPDSVKACKYELVEIISDNIKYLGADCVCLAKVDGFKSIFQRQTIGGNPVTFHISPNNSYIFSHKVPAYRFLGGEMDEVVSGMFELDQLALPDDMIQDIVAHKAPKGSNAGSFSSSTSTGRLPSLKSYPDDKFLMPSWSPNDFATGQVWAVYCGKDLMPRQYARIDSVISERQVCVTFLEPLPILEHEIDWKKENLPIVCGIFKVSGVRVNLEMSQFSYLVRWQQNTGKPLYKIYPLKGEVWAMYRNWNKEWKDSDIESYQCQVVQILSDFSGGDWITVARLGEVNGCLTFFQRQQYDGFDMTHAVSKQDMLSFSHRIPAFRVPGIGRHGIPENSWHLEPNALPLKLGN